jgi:hypothetical protein
MSGFLPLPALLSRAFVAFTVECDNTFEHRVPHRTTEHGATGGAGRRPWLVSMTMWWNYLQCVGEDGGPFAEVKDRAWCDAKTLRQWLGRLSGWWGYVRMDEAGMVRWRDGGRVAADCWRGLAGEVEGRWRERFGDEVVDELIAALAGIVGQCGVDLPDCLPVLGYGLWTAAPVRVGLGGEKDLPGLLARVLYLFVLEFERESKVSLAIGANVLRLCGEEGVAVRELRELAGVSKEGVAMAGGFLEKQGFASVVKSGRTKGLQLTRKGLEAR